MQDQKQRFVYLDAVRGLAALVITFCHFWTLILGKSPIDRVYLAVDFFFVLAGFVSCYAYERRLLVNMSWADFAKRRLIRLYPLYFLGFVIGLGATVIMCIRQHEPLHQLVVPSIAHMLMLPLPYAAPFAGIAAKASEAFPLNLVVWALAYEVFVSLFYGAIVRWLNLKVLLGVIGAFFALYSLGAYTAGSYATGNEMAHILPAICRTGFSYFMGILVFRLSRPGAGNTWLWLPLTIAFYAMLSLPFLEHGNRFIDAPLLLFVLPVFVYLAAKCDMPRRLETISRRAGDLAYPIYMIHFPFVCFATLAISRYDLVGWQVWAVFAVTLALIVGLSALALKYFDEPVRRWLTAATFPKKTVVAPHSLAS